MKKNYVLSVITFLCSIYFSLAQGVIISQYIETSSGTTPKGIEIFNVSGADITFSVANNLEVLQGTNGGACNSLVNITSGTIAADEVWVIGTADLTAYAITNGTDLSGTTDFTFVFNGDDALVLQLGGVIQDTFGTCGTDPGASWNSGGVDTRNNNLQIKDGICTGDLDGWTDPSVRFDEIAVGTVRTGFGDAPASCTTTDTRVVFSSLTSSVSENGTTIDVCVSITNPSATVATTVDIELDASSSATDGTDYDIIPFSFPVTLTFPANSSADQCLTFNLIDDLIYEGDETIVLNLTNAGGGIAAAVGFDDQHVLTIIEDEAPVIADVVITEIMYNTSGSDDEWIEICNTNATPQVLNNYTVRVGGTIEYTFPSTGAVINPGECIVVALGTDGDPTFNDGNGTTGFCPIAVGDYLGTPVGTGTLPNFGSRLIEIYTDTSVLVDDVTYNAITDGASGNGASLHVIDDSLDNSDTSFNWQEVIDGGSPGFNTLISQCSSLQPEINVEGNINSFNDITDGSTSPNFFDNTLFSTIEVATSETKSYRIQNVGTATLNVIDIEIVGANPGDFAVTSPAVLAFPVGDISTGANVEIFEVTFTPTAVGERNATVRITNNDTTDGEDIYEFAIRGNAFCTSASNTLTPLTGPDLTVVTITGTDLDGSTSVEFAGSVLPHVSISPTEIEITIPDLSTSGSIIVTNNIGCQTTDFFTIIDNVISACEGTSGLSPTDLFISEVTDAPTGSHTYIEIFNGTGAAVNLDDYELRVHNNGSNNAGGDIADLSGTLADGDTYVIGIGGGDAMDPEGGFTADDFFSLSGINDNDNIRLYFDDGVTETWLDVWGDTAGSSFTIAAAGYTYRRLNTGITVPRVADWGPADNMQNDWVAITPVDYTDIGLFDFSTGAPPTITSDPSASITNCDLSASLEVIATEGSVGGSFSLTYQWYAIAPGGTTWTALTPSAVYSGVTSAILNISDTVGLDNYQYYCRVLEDGGTNTCYSASNAVRVETQSTVWQSPGAWSNQTPDINTVVVLDFDYNTTTHGDLEACTLIVNSSADLTVENNTYVQVDNDVTVNGTILLNPYGSFVQINDSGLVNGDVLSTPNRITVQKRTAVLQSPQEYTYWSSPVNGESIGSGLNESAPARRFLFNAQNYRDSQQENMNDNSASPGQDDIDDDGNDWQYVTNAATVMTPGVGYAATHSVTGFIGPGNQYVYTFEGPFNNGVITTPVYRNDDETSDNNWNFIGNPYPSAISVDTFFDTNVYDGTTNPSGILNGAVYLWSHNTAASSTTNGNEQQNYSQSDYAVINGTGEVAGGDPGPAPDRFIPSGQGFFVTMADAPAPASPVNASISTGDVIFNNGMRVLSNNDRFFRTSQEFIPNKIRLNLTSDNGVFSQILVGYVQGATDLYDGMYFDAPKNLSIGSSGLLYSVIDNNDMKFGIQGKSPSSLNLDETIRLGFYTSIDTATIFNIEMVAIEGEFMTSNGIYLKDKLLNITHDLSEGPYSFTSETGEYIERFEIVFQDDTLSIIDNEIDANELTILELNDSQVKFSVNPKVTITNIEIYDLFGRTLFNIDGQESEVVVNLSNLSQSVYIAKVALSNGQSITKRAVKRL